MKRHTFTAFICIAALVLAVSGCAGADSALSGRALKPPEDTPGELRILMKSAEDALAAHEHDSALRLYGDIIAQGAKGDTASWAHMRRGKIYLERGDCANAVKELRAVPRRSRDDRIYGEAQALLARAYEGLGRRDAAEDIQQAGALDHGVAASSRDAFAAEARGDKDGYAIGCLMPLSGKYAVYGSRALEAVRLAIGVSGPGRILDVDIVVEDAGDISGVARQAVDKLAGDGRVLGIVGPLGGAASLEAAARAQELEIPLITITHRDDVAGIGDYVFRNFLTASMQVEALVRFAAKDLGHSTFAVMYPRDPLGEEMAMLFRREMVVLEREVRAVVSYAPNQTDFAAEIRALADPEKGDFDALFIPDSGEKIAMIAPQLMFHRVTGIRLLGTSGWNSPVLLAQDAKYVEGAVFTDVFFAGSPDPKVAAFVDRFRAAYGRTPGDMEALAYDSAHMMVSLISKGVKSRPAMRDALAHLAGYRGLTGETSFSPSGEARKRSYILTVRDGAVQQLAPR